MPSAQASFACCDRCVTLDAFRPVSDTPDRLGWQEAGPTDREPGEPQPTSDVDVSLRLDASLSAAQPGIPAYQQSSALAARRRLLKAAVLRRAPDPADPSGPDPAPVPARQAPAEASAGAMPAERSARNGFADAFRLPRTVSGTVLDVSPHVLVLGDESYEQRFAIKPDAVAWRGQQLEPAALRQGDHVVVRLHPGHRAVADRLWANIGRVTGVIAERSADTLIVDEGATRSQQVIVLHKRALGRIQVRFPTLEPGYLVDIIGRRAGDELIAMIAATSQPAYPAGRPPGTPLVSGRVPGVIKGSVTWHEPRDEPSGVLGVDYPALDPETGCAEDAATGIRYGYIRMPYLSIGSVLRVRNDCTGADCLLPVTGCAWVARMFNDRCVTCGTSPRGRIADLTMASFIALGGELERGCFNGTVTVGE